MECRRDQLLSEVQYVQNTGHKNSEPFWLKVLLKFVSTPSCALCVDVGVDVSGLSRLTSFLMATSSLPATNGPVAQKSRFSRLSAPTRWSVRSIRNRGSFSDAVLGQSYPLLREERRQVPTVHQTVEVPQVQHSDVFVDVRLVIQRRVPTIQAVLKTLDVQQGQFDDRMVDVLVVFQRKEKSAEVPQVQFMDRIDDVPVLLQRQVPTVHCVQ